MVITRHSSSAKILAIKPKFAVLILLGCVTFLATSYRLVTETPVQIQFVSGSKLSPTSSNDGIDSTVYEKTESDAAAGSEYAKNVLEAALGESTGSESDHDKSSRDSRFTRDFRNKTAICPEVRRPSRHHVITRGASWQYANSFAALSTGIADVVTAAKTEIESLKDKGLQDRNLDHTTIDVGEQELYIYSAFLDDRPAVGTVTWLRINGVASLGNLSNSSTTSLHCHIWYDDVLTPYVTGVEIELTGKRSGYRYNNISSLSFVQYLFSCRLPAVSPAPTHVSIVTSQCSLPTTLLPVQRPVRAPPDHDFGICVPISFGYVKPEQFIEWIEFYRILGVTDFNIYDSNMFNMSDVFNYYTKLGVLVVHSMPPPIPDLGTGTDAVKLASTVSLNDCMMLNMYRYRFLIVVDFDEIILPRMHSNYHTMLTDIVRKRKLKTPIERFSFKNAYFFIDYLPDDKQPKYLHTARFRQRSKDTKSVKVFPKSFIDPRTCLSVFNHYCYITIDRGVRPVTVDVDPTIAVVQHYRHCQLKNNLCRTLLNGPQTRDDTALRFKDEIQSRVLGVVNELHLPIT